MLVNTIEHHGNRLYGFMGLQSKMLTGWVIGFEEEAGVMRNAMTTRAPGGANKLSKKISDKYDATENTLNALVDVERCG